MSDCLVGRLGSLLKDISSGAVHRHEPPAPFVEDSVQLRLAMDDKPKSVRHAQPEWLIRMLALFRGKQSDGGSFDWVRNGAYVHF
jgi:hypothetical protein